MLDVVQQIDSPEKFFDVIDKLFERAVKEPQEIMPELVHIGDVYEALLAKAKQHVLEDVGTTVIFNAKALDITSKHKNTMFKLEHNGGDFLVAVKAKHIFKMFVPR